MAGEIDFRNWRILCQQSPRVIPGTSSRTLLTALCFPSGPSFMAATNRRLIAGSMRGWIAGDLGVRMAGLDIQTTPQARSSFEGAILAPAREDGRQVVGKPGKRRGQFGFGWTLRSPEEPTFGHVRFREPMFVAIGRAAHEPLGCRER